MSQPRLKSPLILWISLFVFSLTANVKGEDERSTDKPDGCHPIPSSFENVYILGYGSLINSKSKSSTCPDTGPNTPITIKGFTRKFNCRGLNKTYLGVDGNLTGENNGVAFKLPNVESLKKFDKRERLYCRQRVDPSDIKVLGNSNDSLALNVNEGSFWIYVVKPEYQAWPSKSHPIVQSYVDIFLAGCLEMEETYGLEGYADDCVRKTKGWEYSWVNDTIYPRRPWVYQPNAGALDFSKHFES